MRRLARFDLDDTTVRDDRKTWPGQEHEADHVVTDVLRAMEIPYGER